jgi:hypothetical protein
MSELIGVWDWLRSFFAGWDLSEGQYGLIGVMLGFLLSQGVEWIRRRKRHNAFWHAINAELIYSGELAEVFLTDPVQAPLYRLPRSAFETCYPQLLADGAISEAESRALMTFFNEVETLNRGLDLATDHSGDPVKLRAEYERNRKKAKRLASQDGPLYKQAFAAIAKHIK